MVATFTVPLSKVMKELGLTTVYLPMSADEILSLFPGCEPSGIGAPAASTTILTKTEF